MIETYTVIHRDGYEVARRGLSLARAVDMILTYDGGTYKIEHDKKFGGFALHVQEATGWRQTDAWGENTELLMLNILELAMGEWELPLYAITDSEYDAIEGDDE